MILNKNKKYNYYITITFYLKWFKHTGLYSAAPPTRICSLETVSLLVKGAG